MLTVPAGQPEIAHVRVTNVRDVSATVSWITYLATDGRIYYGTDPTNLINVAHDDRGAGIRSNTHHVTIGSLTPGTTYYFYIESDEMQDDNNGSYYQITAVAPLSVPPIDNAWGQVFWNDGTPAAGVLVYLRIVDDDGSGSPGHSAWFSALTDSNGFWMDPATGGAINLAAARTEDGQAYFDWSLDDTLYVEVRAGNGCRTAADFDLASPLSITLPDRCRKIMEFDIRPSWQNIVLPALPDLNYDAQRLLGDIAAQGGCPFTISRWRPDVGDWAGYLPGLPFGNFPQPTSSLTQVSASP